jgi:hypothetical protein
VKDLAPAGIRVNAVSPAFIGPGRMWDSQVAGQAAAQSQYYDDELAAVAERMIGMVSLRRYGSTDEVARVVAFLLSDKASYLTGVDASAGDLDVRTPPDGRVKPTNAEVQDPREKRRAVVRVYGDAARCDRVERLTPRSKERDGRGHCSTLAPRSLASQYRLCSCVRVDAELPKPTRVCSLRS